MAYRRAFPLTRFPLSRCATTPLPSAIFSTLFTCEISYTEKIKNKNRRNQPKCRQKHKFLNLPFFLSAGLSSLPSYMYRNKSATTAAIYYPTEIQSTTQINTWYGVHSFISCKCSYEKNTCMTHNQTKHTLACLSTRFLQKKKSSTIAVRNEDATTLALEGSSGQTLVPENDIQYDKNKILIDGNDRSPIATTSTCSGWGIFTYSTSRRILRVWYFTYKDPCLFPQEKPGTVLPHGVAQRLGDFPVGEPQDLISRVDDGDGRARNNVYPNVIRYVTQFKML